MNPSYSARNIGVIFYKHVNHEAQVSAICKGSFFHLCNISRTRKYLSTHITKTLVHAFVTCKFDNCDSLLFALPQKLTQGLQNCAARLQRSSTLLLFLLICIGPPIKQRFISKFWLLQTRRTMVSHRVILLTYSRDITLLESLRTSNLMLLKVPNRNTASYGERAFSVVPPKLWNSAPNEFGTAENLNLFRSKLKTHLFRIAYF